MTVDLLKLKTGDTVKFRCGGEAVVGKVSIAFSNYCVHVLFVDGDRFSYKSDGSFRSEPHIFDIIEIIPANVESEVEKYVNITWDYETQKTIFKAFAEAIKADLRKEFGRE